jgi:hypothetical protein
MAKLRHVWYPYTDGSIECAALLIIHNSEIRTVVGWQQVQALIIAGWCIPKSSPGLQEATAASERTTLLPRTMHECEMDYSQDPMQFCFGITT